MSAPDPICQVEGMRIVYRRRGREIEAVRGVDFHIDEGSTLALIGESGCGKSSIAKALLGLVPFDSTLTNILGQSFMDFRTTKDLRDFRKSVQLVFQDVGAALSPRMRIASIVAEPMKIHAPADSHAMRSKKTTELLHAVGLDETMSHRYPHELSGGQRQRILIARALATSPKLLIADEPTASLDVSVQVQILRLLADMRRRFRLTMLYISHDIRTVRALTDNVAVMYAGLFVEVGPTRLVLEQPMHPYTQLLLESVPGKESSSNPAQSVSVYNGHPEGSMESGCPFHSRCPKKEAKCLRPIIPLKKAHDLRSIRCVINNC